MDTKRVRFGFVCGNGAPSVTVDMFGPLGPRSIECALVDEKQFVVFTVDKSARASDVLATVVNGMGLPLEKFEGCDSVIITFEKGQRYLQHPFYRLVQGVRQEDANNTAVDAPQRFWQWASDGMEPVKRKRLAGELVSDLVDEAITPSAPKREHVLNSFSKENETDQAMADKDHGNRMAFKHGKKGFGMKSVSPVDVKLLALVNEVSRSKDETIAAKNYAIQLLETMLKNANGQNAECPT